MTSVGCGQGCGIRAEVVKQDLGLAWLIGQPIVQKQAPSP